MSVSITQIFFYEAMARGMEMTKNNSATRSRQKENTYSIATILFFFPLCFSFQAVTYYNDLEINTDQIIYILYIKEENLHKHHKLTVIEKINDPNDFKKLSYH